MKLALFAFGCLLLTTMSGFSAPATHTFTIGDQDFLLDGKPLQIRCGEIHFARVPREYWEHRLKMAKALGLNTVCVYLFWNYHEWNEGHYDWSGQADVVEFCRMAQKEGLWVLLRPGPYSCAEWEMGGLPWWLLQKDKVSLRTSDPSFLEPATRYLKEVGRVLAPLQITHGGPLLMVQVENEYGSYGKDANYMGALRQALIDGGFDVPLFACNPPGAIGSGYREDLFQVVNFGSNPQGAFDKLRTFQKTGPLMNGEFYPAWFDMWGRKHRVGDMNHYLGDLEYMLKNDRSFSIYMAHGGTSFGLWSGADRPFSPDTSSYDYDAPISEAGWVTEKFTKTRDLISRYLQPGESALPEPPPANPVIEIPRFALTQVAPIFANLPQPVTDEEPRPMESYHQSRGCMVYRTTLPPGPAGVLTVSEVHDFAWIFLNGKQVGVMDRRGKRYRVMLPVRAQPMQLDFLLEAMGRVNFGREVADHKGLFGPVEYAADKGAMVGLKNWQIFSLPLDAQELAALKYQSVPVKGPAFWRANFDLARTGDTFLDVQSWGKGVVWINGHCLGRFWNIGPTQTMYCPGPWLKIGKNEVVVLDLLGPVQPALAGLKLPILDEVREELDFAKKTRASGTFSAAGLLPAAEGSFSPDIQWQESKFATPAKGRYLCLEALNSCDSKPLAAVAELDATDAAGQVLSKSKWKILWVSSEETAAVSGDAENVLDGQPASFWHTASSKDKPDYPHRIVIDLGESVVMGGIRYLPRGGSPGDPGRIKDYRVYVSEKPFGLVP